MKLLSLKDLPLFAVIGLKGKERSLTHYDIRKVDDTTIECWIPAIEGKEFEIRCKGQNKTRKQKSLDVRAVIWLDDVDMDGAFSERRTVDDAFGTVSGQPVGSGKTRPFTFEKLELTDNKDAKSIESANIITVELEWGTSKCLDEMQEFTDPQGNGPVHEQSIKAGNPYAVGLGDIQPSVKIYEHEFTPAEDMASITFRFRYASKGWLEAQGIAAPSTTPKSELLPKKFESPPPKKSESPPPKVLKRETRKRGRGKAKAEVIEVLDIKSEPESDDMAPTTSRSKRRKVKVEGDIKPKLEN